MKYKLGQQLWWVEAHSHYSKQVPCTMCFGKLFVTIILGDGSKEKIECGYCKHGLDSPSGFCKTWEPVARVVSGIVYGVSTKDGVRYEVGNSSLYEHALFDNELEAAAFCKLEFERVKALADKYFEESFVRCKASQIWSAGYHKECIKRDERSIEWHKLRLGMIKEKKNNVEKET